MWHGRSLEARVPRVTVAYIYNRNAPARPSAAVPAALTSYVVSREVAARVFLPTVPGDRRPVITWMPN
ncbi:hypothetical protein Strvi_4887 [Streptomyces violaceusniger Tu 4113]|uniref:Uncharacterized protein n=1 Tax=Streptomyces violaceusniger (strain Tu 4113) TaxID=653045 RepID=G2P549_STRV4|nr:hypothetical protein Strvi_4887 [Streptomyces violaceusniger Tu 4113]